MLNWIKNSFNRISNIFYVPTTNSKTYNRNMGGSFDLDKNLSNVIAPINIQRIKTDVNIWRQAVSESERTILPFRYLQQQMYLDVILDSQILACVERRKNLTILRKFKLIDNNGNINDIWSKYLDKKWFKDFISYSLDSIFYGYSLISIGDIINNEIKEVHVIRRGNISPDRYNVSVVPYNPDGTNFLEEPYNNFHIWVDTKNEHGMSNCGYGLFYSLVPLSIYRKNNLIFNIQYNELFGMPFRQLKSDKKEVEERNMLQQSMENMGSKGWIITSSEDDLVFHNEKGAGTAKSFDTLEKRLDGMIAKIILGHTDALESTPGKLGGGQSQGKSSSPQEKSLIDIQSKDGELIEYIVNEKLLPLIRRNGINLPIDLKFKWDNDTEELETLKQQNEQNKIVADYYKTFKDSGLEINSEFLEQITNLKFNKNEQNI